MKTRLILISIHIMISIASFAQTQEELQLKDGVYEYIDSDTISPLAKYPALSTTRRLLVKHDSAGITAHYTMLNSSGDAGSYNSTSGNYPLELRKVENNKYMAENENIKLTITLINKDTIEVEVLNGLINHYYSGGMYRHDIEKLQPQTDRLVFVQTLTDKDEEQLKNQHMANTTSFGQNKNNSINECWVFTISEVHLRTYEIKYNFYKNGTFKAHTNRHKESFELYEKGTYYFQPETNEMFMTISSSNKKNKNTLPKKKCFKIIDKNDTCFNSGDYCILSYSDWEVNEQGKYIPLGKGKGIWYSYVFARNE